MPTLITIQCASQVDAITEDGQPLYQKPYPYHVLVSGEVQQKGLWRGTLGNLIGFQRDWKIQQVDLHWVTAAGFIQLGAYDRVEGLYPVFTGVNSAGDSTMFSMPTPVETITEQEFTDEQLRFLNDEDESEA
jgi:hypothetical protein